MLLSSTVSFMLFFLLLVLSIHMNEALGAQIEIRKLGEFFFKNLLLIHVFICLITSKRYVDIMLDKTRRRKIC